jgi:hypothetical protein
MLCQPACPTRLCRLFLKCVGGCLLPAAADGRARLLHHFATVALIVVSYGGWQQQQQQQQQSPGGLAAANAMGSLGLCCSRPPACFDATPPAQLLIVTPTPAAPACLSACPPARSPAGTNLTRLGVVVLACFAISNPLLHFAKICNQLSLGNLKIGGFVMFALAFFLSRVLLVPAAVLKTALFDSRYAGWVGGRVGGRAAGWVAVVASLLALTFLVQQTAHTRQCWLPLWP